MNTLYTYLVLIKGILDNIVNDILNFFKIIPKSFIAFFIKFKIIKFY